MLLIRRKRTRISTQRPRGKGRPVEVLQNLILIAIMLGFALAVVVKVISHLRE